MFTVNLSFIVLSTFPAELFGDVHELVPKHVPLKVVIILAVISDLLEGKGHVHLYLGAFCIGVIDIWESREGTDNVWGSLARRPRWASRQLLK